MYVHRIKGLSNQFILFNDDIFIGRKLLPNFFFDRNSPKIRMKLGDAPIHPKSIAHCDELLNTPTITHFRKYQLKSWHLAKSKNNDVPWLALSHTAIPVTRDICFRCEEKYPEIFNLNRLPFRSEGQAQWMLLVMLELIANDKIPYKLVNSQLTFWKKHFSFIFRKPVDSFEGTENSKTRRRIRQLKPFVFCINADIKMDQENRKQTRKFLEEFFPNSSPFEQ